MLKKLQLLPIFLLVLTAHAQRGKHGSQAFSGANTLNAYTTLSANAAAGATSIAVPSNTLTSTFLTTALNTGDLIMIIQMQGADLDINTTPTVSWGGSYTLSNSAMGDLANLDNYRSDWGQVTSYNNSGKFEVREVLSITGGGTINLTCGLDNSYTAAGHTQIVRIPRFTNLTLNANATIIPGVWNGTIGGVVALEIDGILNLGTNSKISASSFGFRGGVKDNTSGGPAGSASQVGKPGYSTAVDGSERGEGIGGAANAELSTTYYSRYGCGAAANGGGGANYKNAGGGGGSNIGSGTYTGKGVPTPGYAAFWNLEQAGLATSPSSGGGRGGYSGAQSNQNEATVGPNNSAWAADYRRTEGGFGGHPLLYDATRAFMGGGGGAGEMDDNQGGNGGNGGGIVYIKSYGSITGTGTIEANGANGQASNSAGLTATNASTTKYGHDGAGGAGGGGSILISNATAIPNTITLSANGGNGGNQNLSYGQFATPAEADGPGGGGGGGMIAFTSGTPIQSVAGGMGGVVTTTTYPTNIVANFVPNGATGGAAGVSSLPQTFFDLNVTNVSICSSSSATLTATVVGTLPAGATVTWYTSQYGSTTIGTGLSVTTPVISTTTTYYVGTCPSTFRKPVTVTVGGPTIGGTAVVTDVNCNTPGSITGLTTSGGAAPVTITWNSVVTPGMNLTNASAGTYTVTVTDNVGCTATSGPYTINNVGAGPVINTTNMVVTNESCQGNDGSITGITASGTGLSYSWSNGPSTLNNPNLTAGSYTLTVTDNNGCSSAAGPITVNTTPGPVIDASLVQLVNETCGLGNGSITGLSASGSGLSYSWTNGANTLNITGLIAGTYTLTVTNGLGCQDTYGPITLTNTAGPTIDQTNLSVVDEHCGQSDGSISGLVVNGGSNPLTYSWNSGAFTTLALSNLSATNYSLVVTDNNGCTASVGPITVNAIAGPTVSTVNMVVTPESCSGNDGSITGITASGTGLTYLWNNGPTTLNNSNLVAGSYGLVVTDQFGCFATSGPHTVTGAVAMNIDSTNLVITQTGCTIPNGSIVGLQVVGGVNPTVLWSNSATTLDINSLSAGVYTIVVTDDQNCSIQAAFTVGNSAGVVLDASTAIITNEACGQMNGVITNISISGGTAPFDFVWDNNTSLNTLDIPNMSAGNHQVIVTDALGCSDTTNVTVGSIAGPSIDQTGVITIDPNCAGNNGSISGLVVTGNGPFDYSWSNSAVNASSLTGLSAGTYQVTVTDNNNCTAISTPIVLNQGAIPNADFNYTSGTLIPGQTVSFNDASTGATVQNWVWQIDGVLTSTAADFDFVFSTEGTYVVTLIIQTADGCIDSISKTLTIFGEIIIPNVLTRNADNVNDIFEIKNLKPFTKLTVLNRWGNVVFSTDSYKNDWNGDDAAGEKLSDGTYFYQIITPDGNSWQGYVQLLNQ